MNRSPTTPTPEPERIEVLGVTLELKRHAAPTDAQARRPLLLLHEGLGSVSMWRDWPVTLARQCEREVILYSRQGYGRSDPYPDAPGGWTPDYMHEQAWQTLPILLEALNIEQPVLLGHSDGGSIALLYASRYPCAACIVMAPHVMVEDVSLRAIEQARQEFLNGSLRERLARHHDDVDACFWAWNDAWLNPAFPAFDIRKECQAITCPLLALQGTDDPYGSAEQIKQILPLSRTVERHLLANCGHSPQRDQTQQTTELIVKFLSNLA